MTCGECSRFAMCFEASNNMLDIPAEAVDEGMVNAAMSIPSCEEFTKAGAL